MDIPKQQEDLNSLRERIDAIDARLVRDLNERAKLSKAVGKLKDEERAPIFHPGRETALLDKLRSLSGPDLPFAHLTAIYREILSSSRAVQRKLRVACLGPEGTFSHLAGQEYFGSQPDFILKNNLADVFASVRNRECDLGLVPLENSQNGGVGQSLDLFGQHEVYIQAEWQSRIRLCLLGRAQSLEQTRIVCSHAQPLGQAQNWLRANLPQAAQDILPSTAAAARLAAERPEVAAVGHEKLAALHGLNILARDLEDNPDNWTRFLVIGPEPLLGQQADKSSIMITLADKPGALATVLEILAHSGVNLTKLESRPLRSERWKYLFFADLDCDLNACAQQELKARLGAVCLSLRLLGAYPRGDAIHAVR